MVNKRFKTKKIVTLIVSLVLLVSGTVVFGGAALFYPVSFAYSEEVIQELIEHEYVLDELIIKFKDISEFPGKQKQYKDEVEKVRRLELQQLDNNTFTIKAEDLDKNPTSVINRFKNSRFVDYVEPNYILHPTLVPNDPNYNSQKLSMQALNAEEGWDVITGGGPKVAIIDTGVINTHPDLPPIVDRWAYKSEFLTQDPSGHGTGVAGTVGMRGNNGIGGAGMNWNAQLVAVSIWDPSSSTGLTVSSGVAGINWAVSNGCKILSMSWGSSSSSSTLQTAVNNAFNAGVALFAATGNSGVLNNVSYPARYDNVFGCGGSANGKTRGNITDHGTGIDALALTSAYTTSRTGGYSAMSGTSFSTPQISGLASLVMALQPNFTPTQLYNIIRNNTYKDNGTITDPLYYDAKGWNEEVGYGVIDVGATLRAADAIKKGVAPAVTGITLMPVPGSADMIEKGRTQTFVANVTGVANVSRTVNWSVENKTSSQTQISTSGVLTVGSNETASTITVRATSAVDSSKSAALTLKVINTVSREATPNISIDFAAQKLTGFVSGGIYRFNTEPPVVINGTTYSLPSAYMSQLLRIQKVGNGTTAYDSDQQRLRVPSRTSLTTTIMSAVACTTSANNDGKISGTTTTMEYRRAPSQNWLGCSSTATTGLTPGVYEVRYKATSTAFSGNISTFTVLPFNITLTKEPTPTITIDYVNETLNGFINGAIYRIDAEYVTMSGTTYPIPTRWFITSGNKSIVKVGNFTTTANSDTQSLTWAVRRAAPTGISSTDCTASQNNGTLMNVTTGMEYKLITSSAWIPCSGTTVSGLAAGVYEVRLKSSATQFASLGVVFNICASSVSHVKEPMPSATVNTLTGTLSGLSVGWYRFNEIPTFVDEVPYVVPSAWISTTAGTRRIQRMGNGTTRDSDVQTLSLPARLSTPTGLTATDCTTSGNDDGRIAGVATTMEYRRTTPNTTGWTACTTTSISGLTPGIYEVRRKSTASSFASVVVTLTIASYNSVLTKEVTPTATINYAGELLNGLVAGTYKFNGGSATTISGTTYPIQAGWFGTTISIIRVGNNVTTSDSDPQSILVAARPAAPTTVTAAGCTTAQQNDGRISGVSAAMQYRRTSPDTTDWTTCTGTSISGLVPGKYEIRITATGSAFAGNIASVTIEAFEVPVVMGVTVTPGIVSVQQGSTQTFSAAVSASGGASTTVTWSVTGKNSSNTAISAAGLLTVGANETAASLTVIATSTFDTTKSGTATVTVTLPPFYDISVTDGVKSVIGTTHTFPSSAFGYSSAPAALTLTVGNLGNVETGALTAALSGTNASSFTITSGSITSIPEGSTTRTFTVRPNSGLSVGTYTATVTVSNANVTKTFTVSFSVTKIIMNVSPDSVVFQTVNAGYTTAPDAVTVTVTNASSTATGTLTIGSASISSLFTYTSGNGNNDISRGVPANGSRTFTLRPKTGLNAGAHTAVLVISNSSIETINLSISFTVQQVVAPIYGISLGAIAGTLHTFASAAYGYSTQNALTVTVSNTGNTDTGNLTVAASGANGGSFILSGASITSIPVGATTRTFTVRPNNGLPAGAHTAAITVSGGNGISASFNVSFTVGKADPAYTAPTGLTATYGDLLSSVILPSVANGGWSWESESSQTVGNAGTKTFKAKFTPTDGANYNTITNVSVQITVNKANPIYTLPSGLTATYGDDISTVSLPSGWTWESTGTVGSAGLNTLKAKFTPADTANFNTITNVSVQINVAKANPSYIIPIGLVATEGSLLSSVLLPDGWSWENDTQNVNVGINIFTAQFTPSDKNNYNIVTSVEIRVEGLALSIPTDLAATYGDLLSSVRLPDGWEWEAAGFVGDAGVRIHKAKYTPTGATGIDLAVIVNKANPVYTTPSGLTSTYGDDISTIGLPIGWAWESTGLVGNAGQQTHLAKFTPTDTANFNEALHITVTITVGKAVPVYDVPTGLTATFGDLLSTVGLPTGWTWESTGSVGKAGQQTHLAAFTPSDTDNFKEVSKISVTITVGKAVPVYTVPENINAYYGEDILEVGLPQGWAWESAGQVGEVGVRAFYANFTPADTQNYSIVNNVQISVTVNKTRPEYTIPQGLTAVYGESIAAILLPNGWRWESTGLVGNAGVRTLYATFTPADTVNFATVVNIPIIVQVYKAEQAAVTITGKPDTVTYGDGSFALIAEGGTLPTGTVTFVVLHGSDIINISANGQVVILSAGTAVIVATKAGDENYLDVTAELEITVGRRDINYITVTIVGDIMFTGQQIKPDFTVSDGTITIGIADYQVSYGENIFVAQKGKIILTGSGNYTETLIVEFDIQRIDITVTPPTIPQILRGNNGFTFNGNVFGQNFKLSDITLPTGWTWNQPDAVITSEARTYTFWATYYVDDNFNPFSVEISIQITDNGSYTPTPVPPFIQGLTREFWMIMGAIVLSLGVFSLIATTLDTKRQKRKSITNAAIPSSSAKNTLSGNAVRPATAPVARPAATPTSAAKPITAKPIIRAASAAATAASAPTPVLKDGVYKNAALLAEGVVSITRKTLASGAVIYEVDFSDGRKSKGGESLVKPYLHLMK